MGGEILPFPEINKTLEKTSINLINIMVRLFIKEATTHTSLAIEKFANQTSCDLKGSCVMSKVDTCTFNKKSYTV